MKVTHPSMSHMSSADSSTEMQPDSQPKVYTVSAPDEEDLFNQQMAAMEQEVQSTPASKIENAEDPVLKQEVAKKMAFEKLMFLSQDKYKDIEYGGLTFKFKVLRSSDNSHIINTMQRAGLDEAYKASVMGLAASLISVNGVPFEEFYTGSENITDPLIKKYAELSKWPAFMVTALMAFSSGVQSDVEKEFSRDFLKE